MVHFGGVFFRLVTVVVSLKVALAIARRFRREGNMARVVRGSRKGKRTYRVFKGPKKKKKKKRKR